MKNSYEERLQQAWIGERQGEVFFATLGGLSADPEMKRKWSTLAELERRVGIALERIVEPPQAPIDTTPSAAAARRLAAQPLAEGLASLVGVIDDAVERYNALRDTGPREHAVELQILARHEIALQTFIARELTSEPADSLEAVNELLSELRLEQAPTG